MQITRKQLKQIISEEAEKISESSSEIEELVEKYISDYGSSEEYVSKEAVLDFLEVLEENKIPREAFEALMENLPENTVKKLLNEVVEK